MNKGAAGRFRNITNATKPWLPFRRPKSNDERTPPEVRVYPVGRRWRSDERGRPVTTAVVYLLIACGVLAACFRFMNGRGPGLAEFYLFPFVVVGAIALWTSGLRVTAKLLWSIPLAVVILAVAT